MSRHQHPDDLHRVPFDGSFRLADAPTAPPEDAPGKKKCEKLLEECIAELRELQERLYAQDRYALLLVFQAMDAAGKDSTIRAVMTGINPAGCQVYSFKKPSPEELDHDFLWRTNVRLPERGRIGIFNRSYYEEVLVVRVHPEFLEGQQLPPRHGWDGLWEERFESIRAMEQHLHRNGTVVVKFWLNVSRREQAARFLARLEQPDKQWKYSARDVVESKRWDDYMHAYQEALNATSRPHAPWYAIPADDKPWCRLLVARTVVATLKRLDLAYPTLPPEEVVRLTRARDELAREVEARGE